MRKTSVGVLLGLLFLGALLYEYTRFTSRPSRSCTVQELVLDQAPFPPGAIAGQLFQDRGGPLSPEEAIAYGRTIHTQHGQAIHFVYQYRSSDQAMQKYQQMKESLFSPRMGGPWEAAKTTTYRSSIANQYYVACQANITMPSCAMIAQYREYYVQFDARTDLEDMTVQAFERILRAIDEKMAACLGKPLP